MRSKLLKKFLVRITLTGLLALVNCILINKQSRHHHGSPTDDEGQNFIAKDFNSPTTSPSDPRLLQEIRTHFLVLPRAEDLNSRRSYRIFRDPSDGQSKIVDDFFKQKEGGVFVECGGYDGEYLSNTFFLEKERRWTGLIVEPDAVNFAAMKEKKRKSILSQSCLSTKPHPEKVILQREHFLSQIVNTEELSESVATGKDFFEVQCFPLLSLLLAANISSVDYFSLDVEGQELNVLKSISWNRIDIKVLSVEHRHVREGKAAVSEFMLTKGYTQYMEMHDSGGNPNDYIYVRRDILPQLL